MANIIIPTSDFTNIKGSRGGISMKKRIATTKKPKLIIILPPQNQRSDLT